MYGNIRSEVDVNRIDINDEHKHVEKMHTAAKNMMFPRIGEPFEFNQLLD